MNALVVLELHADWAWFVIISNAVAGVWALGAHRFARLRSRALWWFTGVAEISIFVQATLGVILISRYDIEAPEFHMFYGFVAIIAVGIIYSYRNYPFLRGKVYLLYGGGSLFLMGLAIRAYLQAAPF